MLAYLEGAILSRDKNSVIVLMKNGLGYEVKVKPGLFLGLKKGDEVKLFTYFHVREDSQELYGVSSAEELTFLKLLVSVSGVGPRSALHILSLGSVGEISAAISRGDLPFLTKVSGIGRKIAERIVVELKEKINLTGKSIAGDDSTKLGDVVDALASLGYSATEAREAVRQVKETRDTSLMLKQALKILNKRN